MSLLSIPTELHLIIKSHLDPIDATCFALTCPQLYNTSIAPPQARITSSVNPTGTPSLMLTRPLPTPLNYRPRPNLSRTNSSTSSTATSGTATPVTPGMATPPVNSLSPISQTTYFDLQVPDICRHCRSTRCELHNHIASFLGGEYEFCSVRSKFIRGEDGHSSDSSDDAVAIPHRGCWRSCPPRPGVCGRHGA